MGAEEVGIIDAADPETLPFPCNWECLVEQEGEAGFFQRAHFFKEVMIAKNRKSKRMQCRNESQHFSDRVIKRLPDVVMVITRKNNGIVRGGCDALHNPMHDPGIEITVEIGKLQQAEALERFWESGYRHDVLLDPEIQGIRQSTLSKTKHRKQCADAGIDGEVTFEGERSQTLSKFSPNHLILKVKATFRPFFAQAFADFHWDVVTAHRITLVEFRISSPEKSSPTA